MNVTRLHELSIEQKEHFLNKDIGLERDVDFRKYLNHKQIVVVSGVRRAGKSTLLRQFAEKLKDFHFINFDDERLLNFTVDDFQTLMLAFHKNSRSKYIILDEIQNIDNWERFVRRIHDEGYKVYITGSNAKLLSSELSTHLTGRYVKIELYPFSFSEFVRFKNIETDKLTTLKKAEIISGFDAFLINGGFPEFLKYEDEEFIKRTYNDIIHRDILTKHAIRNAKQFKQLSHYLFSNFTGDTSYHGLKTPLSFSNVQTIINYIGYLEESYLVFELYKYDYSLKKQYVNTKKIYVIDNGMRNQIAFTFSKDYGKYLENVIFLELKRRYEEIYFFRETKECDFLIIQKGVATLSIQVCYELNDGNIKRELDGLKKCMKTVSCRHGILLTYNNEESITEDDLTISVIPAWKWLLGL